VAGVLAQVAAAREIVRSGSLELERPIL
jgi:hypothetical protein